MHPPALWIPAAPRIAVIPAGLRLLRASIQPGWRRQWWQGHFLQSGRVLIIAVLHSSIFYPCYEFSCCFYASEADHFFLSEVSLWSPGYHLTTWGLLPLARGICWGKRFSDSWRCCVHTHCSFSYFSHTNCCYPGLSAKGGLSRQAPPQEFFRMLPICMYVYVHGPCEHAFIASAWAQSMLYVLIVCSLRVLD